MFFWTYGKLVTKAINKDLYYNPKFYGSKITSNNIKIWKGFDISLKWLKDANIKIVKNDRGVFYKN